MTTIAPQAAPSDFYVRYDGPSVENGRMEVRHLAPALIGIAEAIQEAARLVDPTGPDVRVDITATERGSFHVGLELLDLLKDGGDLLSGRPGTTLANFRALLLDPVLGLFAYWRLKKSNKVVEPEPDGSVVFRQGDISLTFPAEVVTAGNSVSVRTSMSAALDPLADDPGITTCEIGFSSRTTAPNVLTRNDAYIFEVEPEPDQPIADDTFTAQLRIVKMAMEQGLAWQFDEGGRRMTARVSDDAFRSLASDPFHIGDSLRAKVRRQQWDRAGRSTTQYEIIEVIKHEKAPEPGEQLAIDSE